MQRSLFMQRSRSRHVAQVRGLVALVLLVNSGIVRADGVDAECLKLLRTEGVAAWKQHESSSDGISYTGHFVDVLQYSDRDGKPKQLDRDYTFRVKRQIAQQCVLVEQNQPDGLAVVKGMNPDYRFELDRQADGADWLLSRAGTSPDTPQLRSNDYYWDWYAWKIEGGISLIDILTRDNAFRVDEASLETAPDGRRRVHLKATTLDTGTRDYGQPGTVYTATVVPDNAWAIERFSVQYPSAGSRSGGALRSGEITYYEREGGPPFVRTVLMTVEANVNGAASQQSTTVELDLPEALSDTGSFYLTHYGVDDEALQGDTGGGLRRAGWFLLGLSALALTWWLIARRAKSATESGSTP